MDVGRNFDPIDPGEVDLFGMDFVKDLADNETIVSSTWECRVADGSAVADALASSRIIGDPVVQGTATFQTVSNCVAGVTYVLLATVVTSIGLTKSLWAHVECRPIK